MTFPRAIEHSKNYFVQIQLFGDRFIETNSTNLHYLVTDFKINHSGGSSFVHQKGRSFASAFPTQPTNTVNVMCVMTEPDFAIITSAIITEQQQILLSIGKIGNLLDTKVRLTDFGISEVRTKTIGDILIEESALIFEAIGYLSDAQITARVGEYIIVDFTMNVDDIHKIRTDDRFGTNAIPEFDPTQ